MKDKFAIILIVLVSLITILPLFHSGFFPMHDDTQVARVYEMQKSLLSGMMPVRWVEDLGYGYGYPIFNFYAPFAYYIGAFFTLIGFGILSSTKIMIGIGVLLSGVTMYFFGKKFFGRWPGITAAIVYMYFPYHAVNLYVRGAVGEIYGYAFIPLILLSAFSLFGKYQKNKNYGINYLLIISISLVAISHNLTLLMTLLILFIFYIVSLFFIKNKIEYSQNFWSSLVLGLLLSSFYIIPAFNEMKLTNVASQVGGGADFKDHFVCLNQLWDSSWGFGGSVKGCVDGLSFRLGKSNIIFLILSLVLFIWSIIQRKKDEDNKLVLSSCVLLLFSLFMTLPVSSILWEKIPYLPFIQYPWRFIEFVSLFASFIAAYGIWKISEFINKKLLVIGSSLLVIIFTLGLNAKLFVPQKNLDNSDSYYKNNEYLKWTVSKISDEYMPSDFIKPVSPSFIPKNPIEINGGKVNLLRKNSNEITAAFESNKTTFAKINVAFFPGWTATLNGHKVSLIKTSFGMSLPLPINTGVISLKYMETPIERVADFISILVLVSLVLVSSRSYLYKKN